MQAYAFCHYCGQKFSDTPYRMRKRLSHTNGIVYCSKSCKMSGTRGAALIRFYTNIAKPISFDQCWVWIGGTDSYNYGRLFVDQQERLAHRYSYEIHRGPIPPTLLVLHKCNNTRCVNPYFGHLYLGTAKDNTRDMLTSSTYHPPAGLQGEHSSSAVLTTADVLLIRALHHKEQGIALAHRFGVSPSTISAIQHGRLWKHLL